MMRTGLLRLRLRLAGRRAALLSLLLMLWVIPSVGAASSTAPAMASVAKTAPVADPCDQLAKDSPAYEYCKNGDAGTDSDSGSAADPDADAGGTGAGDDSCKELDGPSKDYCENGADADLDVNPFACEASPSIESPGDGLLGWIDPGPATAPAPRDPSAAGADAYIYEQYGYAGLRWSNYIADCANTSGLSKVLNSENETWWANRVFTWSKAWTAVTVVLRQYVTDETLFSSLDPAIADATQAVRNAMYSPWIGTSLVLLGTTIIIQARRRNLPDVMGRIAWALLVMTVATGVANYPVEASKFADKAMSTTISAIDQAFASSDPAADPAPTPSSNKTGTASATPAQYPADQAPTTENSREQGNTSHGNMLVHNVLYSTWLRGELGTDDSAVARKYGMELFDSQALTWRESRLPSEQRSNVIKAKQQKFKELAAKIQKEDPTAYAHLTGVEGGRVGAASISNFQAAASNTFSLVGDLVIVCGKWMLRLIVIFFPALAVIGLHRRTSGVVKTAFNGTMAAVINIPLFAAGSALDVRLVEEISAPEVDLPPWLKVVLLFAVGYVMWKILRPLTRLSAMINPNHNYLGDAGSAVTGPARFAKGYAKYYLGTRYLRRILGRQADALEDIADAANGGQDPDEDEGRTWRSQRDNNNSDDWWSNNQRGRTPSPSGGGGGAGALDIHPSYQADDDLDAGLYGRGRGTYVPAGSLPGGGADDVWDTEGWWADDLPASPAGHPLPVGASAGGRGRSAGSGSMPAAPSLPGGPAPVPPGDGGGAAVLPPGSAVPTPRSQSAVNGSMPRSGSVPAGDAPRAAGPVPPPASAPEGSRPVDIPESQEPRVIPPSVTDDGPVYVIFNPDQGFSLRDERDDEDGGEL